MRLLLLLLCFLFTTVTYAQEDWIAPEGKILNYRTLTWNDFQNKEDKDHAEKLAERNLEARAYVCPSIYFKADSGETQDNGRVKFTFHVKCAFQSRAFVRESTKEMHSDYVLIHEQDHYDIALTYANKLQAELSSRDYSGDKYSEEIDKIYDDLMNKYHKTQETYDAEVNPNGTDDVAKQHLWDMRINKCLENNTDEYYASPETNVQSVKAIWQIVKRIPGEPNLQFVVRARPLYCGFQDEMKTKIFETSEWTKTPALTAFYTQKYFTEEEGAQPKECVRTMGYLFVPTAKDTYKRILIDTFSCDGIQEKIAGVFWVNADSDNVKELVVMTTVTKKDKQATGTLYVNRIYDDVAKVVPAKMKKLDEVATKIEGGFEGVTAGKPTKAKYRSEKEIAETLRKLGYQ